MAGFRGEFVDDESYDPCFDPDEGYECECIENVDIDIIAGRCLCLSCGRAWWMTKAEMVAEAEFQAQAYEDRVAEFSAPSSDKQ